MKIINNPKNLVNFRELSRRLGYSEKGLDPNRIPKKYKIKFKYLYDSLEDFIDELSKIK